jgi:hypothetical protein
MKPKDRKSFDIARGLVPWISTVAKDTAQVAVVHHMSDMSSHQRLSH